MKGGKIKKNKPTFLKNKNKKDKIKNIIKTSKLDSVQITQVKINVDESDGEKFPLLNDQALIKKFQAVSLTNNQKGRIRQLLRDSMRSTSKQLLPNVIHNQIESIVKSNENLSDSELRKIRILHNMLKVAITESKTAEGAAAQKKKQQEGSKKKNKDKGKSDQEVMKVDEETVKNDEETINDDEENVENNDITEKEDEAEMKVDEVANKDKKVKGPKDKQEQKVKGPKRYVVFVGNLPLGVTKEVVKEHFIELEKDIVDVRVPKEKAEKKSCIAYVELKDEPSYEMALSKNHSMLANKRINVSYSIQQNSKISKTEAKSKSAKLRALQKSGQLLGSIPMNKKRSQRRKKLKAARAKESQNN